jgi:hypothetical protein
MDRLEFLDNLNKISEETGKSILYHGTKFEYLESILNDGAILPLSSREDSNTNFLSNTFSNMRMREDTIEKYKSSVFISMKSPAMILEPRKFFNKDFYFNLKEDEYEDYIEQEDDEEYYLKDEVFLLIDPYSIDEKVFINSHVCFDWYYGRFYNEDCRKWNNDKSLEHNIKKWEKFIDKKYSRYKQFSFSNATEIVIRHPEGINLKSILVKNPKGVMIVIRSEKPESHFKDLMEKYPDFVWIILK